MKEISKSIVRWLISGKGLALLLAIILLAFQDYRIDPVPRSNDWLIFLYKIGVRYLCWTLLLLGLFSRSRLISWAFIVYMAAFSILQYGYYSTSGSIYGVPEAKMMLGSRSEISNSIGLYFNEMFFAVILIVSIYCVTAFVIRRRLLAFKPKLIFVSISAIILFSLTVRFPQIHNATPAPIRIPSSILYTMVRTHIIQRDKPYIAPPGETAKSGRVPHIIVLMDESVKGSELSINSYSRPTTPYLQSISDSFWNGGIASSGGFTTLYSHSLIYNGITYRDMVGKKIDDESRPTLIQYSAQAGYSSKVIDSAGDIIDSVFADDVSMFSSDVFEKILVRGKTNEDNDFAMIPHILQHLSRSECTLTYVIKTGAHYPYYKRYPSSAATWTPDVPTEMMDFEKQANSYDNSIKWSVDGFFRELIPQIQAAGQDVLILYTSDHGQVIFGSLGKNGPKTSHGGKNLPSTVANVPMLAFSFGEKSGRLLEVIKNNNTLHNNCSHSMIFPTLLIAMGYDRDQVIKLYGESLLDELEPNRKRQYVNGPLSGVVEIRDFERVENRPVRLGPDGYHHD